MKNKHSVIISLTVGLTLSVFANNNPAKAASFAIDRFYGLNTTSQSVKISTTTTVTGTGRNRRTTYTPNYSLASNQKQMNGTLGEYRDLALTNFAGFASNPTGTSNTTVSSGTMSWNNDTGLYSDLAVTWDGNDSATSLNKTGLGGIDITHTGKLDGIFIQLISPDLTAQNATNISLDIYDMSSNKYSLTQSVKNLTTVEGNTGVFFDFAQFSNGTTTPIDESVFQNIGAIQMNVAADRTKSQSSGVDLQLALIKAVNTDVETPEPAISLATLGGMMLSGWLARKKKA
jgi:hypothetical protein